MHSLKRIARKVQYQLFGDTNYTPFILLSTARTGSNLISSHINSHPQLKIYGEMLKRLNGRKPEKIISDVWGSEPKRFKAVGFKLFYGHPFDSNDKESWKIILEKPNLRIIHLKRDNAVRSLISERIASQNDEWLIKGEKKATKNTQINYKPDKLIRKLNQLEDEMTFSENFFKNIPRLNLKYEQLANNDNAVMKQVCDFLNVEPIPTQTVLVRQNPEPLSTLVSNWDEIIDVLKGTKWEKFLTD